MTAKNYVTRKELDKYMEAAGRTTREFLNPHLKRLEAALIWRGTWRNGESYALNDLVQDKGTVFVAVSPKAEGRPGTDSGWRQLVKTSAKEKP